MKKLFTLQFLPVILLISATSVRAQITWDFTTATASSNSYSNVTAGAITQGNNNGTTTLLTTTSPSSGYAGASGNSNAGIAARAIGFDPAQTAYFEFTLTPTGSNSVVLTGIAFGSRSTATGPTAISVRTSVNAYATDQFTAILTNNSNWALYDGALNVTGIAGTPVTVRIYGYNGTGNPGTGTANWRIDDLIINPVALPLNLLSFKAALNGKTARLNWNTVNELNVLGFTVEKSIDGVRFNQVGFVGALNNNVANSYVLEDNNVNSGVNYYRLKMEDKDGSAKYSPVAVVRNVQALATQLFPNPAISTVSVTHARATEKAAFRIINLQGQVMKTLPVQSGAIQSSLTVGELSRGNYVLVYDNNGVQSSASFVKH